MKSDTTPSQCFTRVLRQVWPKVRLIRVSHFESCRSSRVFIEGVKTLGDNRPVLRVPSFFGSGYSRVDTAYSIQFWISPDEVVLVQYTRCLIFLDFRKIGFYFCTMMTRLVRRFFSEIGWQLNRDHGSFRILFYSYWAVLEDTLLPGSSYLGSVECRSRVHTTLFEGFEDDGTLP